MKDYGNSKNEKIFFISIWYNKIYFKNHLTNIINKFKIDVYAYIITILYRLLNIPLLEALSLLLILPLSQLDQNIILYMQASLLKLLVSIIKFFFEKYEIIKDINNKCRK